MLYLQSYGDSNGKQFLYGIANDLLRRLQSVQNAAARLVAGSRRSGHITPVLRRLHWLPVRRRIEFKLALLIYESLNGSTPRYLSDDCQLVSDVGRRRLRSSDVSTCIAYGSIYSVVSEIFNVEKYHDLEIRVRGHSRSLKMVPFDILRMVSY